MKTTLDLPNDLVQEIELRAVNEGRKPKDVAVDLLRAALASPPDSRVEPTAAVPKTLPIIQTRSMRSEGAVAMTAQDFSDWIKQVDFDLDVDRYETVFGHQRVDGAQP